MVGQFLSALAQGQDRRSLRDVLDTRTGAARAKPAPSLDAPLVQNSGMCSIDLLTPESLKPHLTRSVVHPGAIPILRLLVEAELNFACQKNALNIGPEIAYTEID